MYFKATVIVPTLNRKEFLRRCLDSLMVQDFDDFEILVIDGGSRDGSLDLAKSYCENGCSKLAFFSEPSGIIHSYNRGLKEARGEIAMFVDDDVIVDKDWVSRVVQVFDTDEKFAGVGGRIFDMGVMNRRPKRFGDIYDSLFYEKARARAIGKICKSGVTTRNFHLKTENPICVDYILGCNMSFRRRLLLDSMRTMNHWGSFLNQIFVSS